MKHYFSYHPSDPAAPEIDFEDMCDAQDKEAENEFEENLLSESNNN